MADDPFNFQGQPSSRPAEPTDLQKQPNPQMPGAGYQPPPLGDLAGGEPSKLGSLAHSAREKHIKQAKIALLLVGVLWTVMHAFQWLNLPHEINKMKADFAARGMYMINEDEVYKIGKMTYGGACLLGISFIVMGLMVRSYPLPCCITALTLFILAQLGFAYIDPMNLVRGFIVKLVVLVVLIKAIQAAIASEKERQRVQAVIGSMPSE